MIIVAYCLYSNSNRKQLYFNDTYFSLKNILKYGKKNAENAAKRYWKSKRASELTTRWPRCDYD